MPQLPAKAISSSGRDEAAVATVVAGGDEAVGDQLPAPPRRRARSRSGVLEVGRSSPIWPKTWASAEPPRRCAPAAEVDEEQAARCRAASGPG